jgi:pimeloyl-ACP methyl ester carboxylesterase
MVLGQSIALATERIVAPIEGMHLTISNTWFAATGVPGRAVQRVHDVASRAVYRSVEVGGAVLGGVVSGRVSADSQTPVQARAIVNGLWGDDLGHHERNLGISMEIRGSDGELVADSSGLVHEPSAATPHLVVLVHGLFESEMCWSGGRDHPSITDGLDARPHLTALGVRYNSGRRISDNAAELTNMLDVLCANWPVQVESIVLIGNSMGGLLIRGACTVAERRNRQWVESVTQVVTVATPHLGTPIEKGVAILSAALSIADSTRPLGHFLDSRSQGIKDLRHGRAVEGGNELAAGIDHHAIAAVVTADPGHPIGSMLGDLVVRPTSASMGHAQTTTIVGGTNHFGALASPAVIDRVLECVDPGTIATQGYEPASS